MSFVPYVVEQSAHGERSYDIFSRVSRNPEKYLSPESIQILQRMK